MAGLCDLIIGGCSFSRFCFRFYVVCVFDVLSRQNTYGEYGAVLLPFATSAGRSTVADCQYYGV